MRQRHFDALQPQCPRCREAGRTSPLRIATVDARDGDLIWAGILHCTAGGCQLEFPIIDGIPIIVANVRGYLASSTAQILRRADLPANLLSLIGDATGPESELDQTRQQLSTYAWSHYGEFDPAEDESPQTGGLVGCLDAGLKAGRSRAPALDLGCSVGRTTFELARRVGGLTLGVDLNFAMLQMAQAVLRSGRVGYDRRRIGLVYDHREFDAKLPAADDVDFWACDVTSLPFAKGQFGTAIALNVLDCVGSPSALVSELRRVLEAGGAALLSTPYDWSPAATPAEGWIGGHSQRSDDDGDGPTRLRTLLASVGLELAGEIAALPWRVRVHSRSAVSYRNHVLMLRSTSNGNT